MEQVLGAAGAARIEVSRDEAQRLKFLERPQERTSRRPGHSPTTCVWIPQYPAAMAEMLRANRAHAEQIGARGVILSGRRRQSQSPDLFDA